jgi:hypothetical protein
MITSNDKKFPQLMLHEKAHVEDSESIRRLAHKTRLKPVGLHASALQRSLLWQARHSCIACSHRMNSPSGTRKPVGLHASALQRRFLWQARHSCIAWSHRIKSTSVTRKPVETGWVARQRASAQLVVAGDEFMHCLEPSNQIAVCHTKTG